MLAVLPWSTRKSGRVERYSYWWDGARAAKRQSTDQGGPEKKATLVSKPGSFHDHNARGAVWRSAGCFEVTRTNLDQSEKTRNNIYFTTISDACTYIRPSQLRRVLLARGTSGRHCLLLQTSSSVVVVVPPLGCGVPAAKVESVPLEVKGCLFVASRSIPSPGTYVVPSLAIAVVGYSACVHDMRMQRAGVTWNMDLSDMHKYFQHREQIQGTKYVYQVRSNISSRTLTSFCYTATANGGSRT